MKSLIPFFTLLLLSFSLNLSAQPAPPGGGGQPAPLGGLAILAAAGAAIGAKKAYDKNQENQS